MRKPYRPKTVSLNYLNETLSVIEGMADDYARRHETARQQYEEFVAWEKESPEEVAEWRAERERKIQTQGRLWADDDPVAIYEGYLQNTEGGEYSADAGRLRAIIAAIPGTEAAVSDEIYGIVSAYNRFVRPQRFWEKGDFRANLGLIVFAAAIYYFGASTVGWFFIGLSALYSAFLFYHVFTCKGVGCVNGIMLLPAIILLFFGVAMVGALP